MQRGITFDNVTFKALKKDYRPAVVTDDAEGVTFKNVPLCGAGERGEGTDIPI